MIKSEIELKGALLKVAKRSCWEDGLSEDEDAMVDDFAGGNIDDAYAGGMDSGEILFARELLMRFFGEDVEPTDDE